VDFKSIICVRLANTHLPPILCAANLAEWGPYVGSMDFKT